MSPAAIAGRVAGPTYLRGSTLGTAAAALGVTTSLVELDAEEQAPRSDVAVHATANEERLTITPW
jgi:hypothetical protein